MRATRSAAMVLGLTGVVLTEASLGQVVLPPGPPPAKLPEYVPPPPAPVRSARPTTPPRVSERNTIPDVKYESIVKRDAQGRLNKLPAGEARAALEVNPLIDASTREKVNTYLAWRDRRTAQLVVTNLDIFRQASEGGIEQIDFRPSGDLKAAFGRARELTQPLVVADLDEDLRKRGILTIEQSQINKKIASEYQQEVMKDLRAEHGGASATEEQKKETAARVPRYVYLQRVDEARRAYVMLLAKGMADETGAFSAGLNADATAAIAEACKAPLGPQRASALDAALRKLPLDQQRAYLTKILESLPAIAEPPSVIEAVPAPTDAPGQ